MVKMELPLFRLYDTPLLRLHIASISPLQNGLHLLAPRWFNLLSPSLSLSLSLSVCLSVCLSLSVCASAAGSSFVNVSRH
jgi:hypothetical protein